MEFKNKLSKNKQSLEKEEKKVEAVANIFKKYCDEYAKNCNELIVCYQADIIYKYLEKKINDKIKDDKQKNTDKRKEYKSELANANNKMNV